jgi:hypothetical protein
MFVAKYKTRQVNHAMIDTVDTHFQSEKSFQNYIIDSHYKS